MNEAGAFAANDETLPMAEYAIRELSGYGLSHALIMGATTDFAGTPLQGAEGNFVMLHGRFTGPGQPANRVVVDILRLEDGVMLEHRVRCWHPDT